MSAQLDRPFTGSEFDAFMGAPAPSERPAMAPEAPAEIRAREGGPRRKPAKEPMPRKKKLMLMGGGVGVLALAVAGFAARRPAPPPVVSPDVAAVMAKASEVQPIPTVRSSVNDAVQQPAAATPAAAPSAAEPTNPINPLASASAAPMATVPADPAAAMAPAVPMPDAAAQAKTTPATPAAPAAKAPVAAPVAAASAPIAPPAPTTAAPAPKAPKDASSAAGSTSAADVELARVRAEAEQLRRDLAKARAAAARPAVSPAPSYTVVAVLNDGVVVRDAAGREKVVSVGTRIAK